jgi:hypothetical protein
VPTVDGSWPDYWDQVDTETAKVGSSRAAYVALDHDHVVDWFARHWDLLEPLVDDPDLAHVRFATFDGDQLAYRFRVIGMESGGTVRLVEFAIIE